MSESKTLPTIEELEKNGKRLHDNLWCDYWDHFYRLNDRLYLYKPEYREPVEQIQEGTILHRYFIKHEKPANERETRELLPYLHPKVAAELPGLVSIPESQCFVCSKDLSPDEEEESWAKCSECGKVLCDSCYVESPTSCLPGRGKHHRINLDHQTICQRMYS